MGFSGKYIDIFNEIIKYNYTWDVEALEKMEITNIKYDTTEIMQDFSFNGIFNEEEELKRNRMVNKSKKKNDQTQLDQFL